MKLFLVAGLAAAVLLGDGTRIPPCCLAKVEARAAQAHKARVMQGQEHKPGTCNNHFQNVNPCKCHFATACPPEDENGAEQPRPEDPICQQYCDKGDCHCIHPCTS